MRRLTRQAEPLTNDQIGPRDPQDLSDRRTNRFTGNHPNHDWELLKDALRLFFALAFIPLGLTIGIVAAVGFQSYLIAVPVAGAATYTLKRVVDYLFPKPKIEDSPNLPIRILALAEKIVELLINRTSKKDDR